MLTSRCLCDYKHRLSIGFGSTSMVQSHAVVAKPGATPTVQEYRITSKGASGVVAQPSQDITATSISQANGQTIVQFTRKLDSSDSNDHDIGDGDVSVAYAYGSGNSFGYHGGSRGVVSINFKTGASATVGDKPIKVAHGILMYIAWGVLIPTGVMIARFGRHVPPNTGPAQWWFTRHRAIQSFGVLVGIAGAVLAVIMVNEGGSRGEVSLHGILGYIVTGLGVLQPVNAILRPHPGPGAARKCWSAFHKVPWAHACQRCGCVAGISRTLCGSSGNRLPADVWAHLCHPCGAAKD